MSYVLSLIALVFGALGAQFFSDTYGRRRTFVVAAVGFIVGVVIMAVSQSYGLLLFGRAFVGLGVGVGLAVSFASSAVFEKIDDDRF